MNLEELLASLANIAEMDNDQLTELATGLRDGYKELRKEPVTPEIVDTLSKIADGIKAVETTIEENAAAAEQAEQALKDLDAQVLGEPEAKPGEKKVETKTEPKAGEAEAKPKDGAKAEGEPVLVAGGKPTDEAIALATQLTELAELSDEDRAEVEAFAAAIPTDETIAFASQLQQLAALSDEDREAVEQYAADTAEQEPAETGEPEVVTASLGTIAGRQPGSSKPKVTNVRDRVEIRDLNGNKIDQRQMAETFAQQLNGMGRTEAGFTQMVALAAIVDTAHDPSSDRYIGSDYRHNGQVIDRDRTPESLLAAGGIGAPRAPIYDIYHVGTNTRPVKASLPNYNADRGGVRIPQPKAITSVGTSGGTPNQAMENVTAASDAAGHTKVYQEFAAPVIQDYDVEANPLITQHGNMNQRFFPEAVAHDLANSEDAYARFSENLLLTKMAMLSTAVTKTQVLGAAVDILNTVNRTARQVRNRNRTDVNAPVRVVLPYWVVGVFQRDIASRNNLDPIAAMSVTEADVNAVFANIKVNVTWTLDGVGSSQIAPAQGTGALNGDPTVVVWYAFLEGTFLYLDGGQLDLGVVRDSTLNLKNKYQIFREEFWNLAFVGLEAFKVQQTFCVNGATTGTVTPSSVCSGGS